MGAEFDSSAPWNQEEETIECDECKDLDDSERLSSCCGAEFAFPGWPDSDICTADGCHEHSGYHCDKCNGDGYVVLSGIELKEYHDDLRDANI